ncbi:MAG: CpsD/CapB family tyrosine-protein kinase [Clostridia bacterium]|nr:CpsD/CapB family tyrosine-protein kinase [Clostridia bacterium]
MKLLDRISNHIRRKNMQKDSEGRGQAQRIDYIIDEDTPFDVTEAFRNLKATLSVSVPKKSGGVAIMTSSAYPREGKTTVAVNLALMFAISDAKVVLIDTDLRKGRVAKYFKRKRVPGLSDYLSGQAELEEVVHHSHINENLSYITCGTRSPRPYELLESEEMKAFIEEMKEKYDYVIIDTPPVLMVSDALALATAVDGAVLICRHQVSFVSDISRALSALRFAKANVLGVVVNDYKAPQRGKYYGNYKKYYYYNNYGYTYGSTKAEDKEDDLAVEELSKDTKKTTDKKNNKGFEKKHKK